MPRPATAREPAAPSPDVVAGLDSLARHLLWLSTYVVHVANHERGKGEGVKVGGHQASSASCVSLMTALWFGHLRADDRVAVKPHASPVLYSIQHLLGNLTAHDLTTLRAFGGLQSYPSRRRNPEFVDFSTGSVGLGAVAVNYDAVVQRYLATRGATDGHRSLWAIVGDAELDEGNIWESVADPLLDGVPGIRWVVDLNRQSLDRVVPGIRVQRLRSMFAANGWRVVDVKYGRLVEALFRSSGGNHLRSRVDRMSNEEYQLLVAGGADGCRERLLHGMSKRAKAAVRSLVSDFTDEALHRALTELGGHDQAALLDAYAAADAEPGPAVVFAYTVKGWGLPFAGDRLNHAALLTPAQVDALAEDLEIGPYRLAPPGPDDPARPLVDAARARFAAREVRADRVTAVPAELRLAVKAQVSTQEVAGRLLVQLARQHPEVSSRVVTTAPDVAVSTNLAGWINQVGVWSASDSVDYDDDGGGLLRWQPQPHGQHLELGIAEMNLFLLLGQLGVAAEAYGHRLIPIGTVYDPFVLRGLDALIYALYNGGRFIVLGTPSGVTLAPEGGAHQSTVTASLGIELPHLDAYEPCFAQELEWILLDAIRAVGAGESSAYLRLSTLPVDQSLLPLPDDPDRREARRRQVLSGAHRVHDARRAPGYRTDDAVLLFAAGISVVEALRAAATLEEEGLFASVFSVTSAGKLYAAWQSSLTQAIRHAELLDDPLDIVGEDERGQPAVTVIDAHPHALSFIGAAVGSPTVSLGVVGFGQSGTVADLYRTHNIDAESITTAAIAAHAAHRAARPGP